MFGFEDNLLHKLARVTNLFTANHMQERYWPVHVGDTDAIHCDLHAETCI